MRRSLAFRRPFADQAPALAVAFLLVALTTSALGNIFVVNSALDEPDADPSTGKCVSTPSGVCTLRAAIMVANFVTGPNTITVPSGTYLLKRPGYDDDALVGDLDIKHDLTVQGAGSGVTIIDGNGAVTHDRVFQVLSTVQNVTLNGMTIRKGESLTRPSPTPTPAPVLGGGALYIEGAAQVHLSDVILDSNSGQNGGGIYANFSATGGSLKMDKVIVRGNKAMAGGVGQGGGVYARLPSGVSHFVVQDSQIYSNMADGTGGGLFVDGNSAVQWSIQRTQIYSNTAASGGGIGNFAQLTLSDSDLHDNHATYDGGAIEADSPFSMLRTTLNANSAGRFGGGIFDLQTGSIPGSVAGKGQNFAHIAQSTLSGNSAQYGGGIYHDGFIVKDSQLTLLNSTVSGNTVFRARGATGSADGAGIYVYQGKTQLLNTTIAMNRIQLGFGTNSYSGQGGGIFVTAGPSPSPGPSPNLDAQNSLIANNTRGNRINVEQNSDCVSSNTTGQLAYDLIRDNANCFVTGPQGGNIFGQDPLLGPLQDNGGPTQTHSLMSGSPAIDTAAPGGCTDDTGAPLTIDQRGFPRPYPAGGPCDMGAVELQPVLSINDVKMAEGASGTTSFVFTVSLSPASAQTVTVDLASANGTAAAGSDYQPVSKTLTFNPGEISKTVTVLVNGDKTFESDETFFVNLSNAANAPIAKSQGRGTILNDDSAPTPTPTATPKPTVTPTATPKPSPTPTPTPTPKATPTPHVTPTPTPSSPTLGNISTRVRVETRNNVLIGGFIVTGTQPKKVLIRAIGPSLQIAGHLDDPQLELYSGKTLLETNDNWGDSPEKQAIIATTIPPSNTLESAIVRTLPANNSAYTAIVRGVNNGTGVGLVEVYDLDSGVDSKLANISTRGLVGTDENVMIGGFIVLNGNQKVIVRAIGPSLPVSGALEDPVLELHTANGAVLQMNDNWRTGGQEAEIIATTVPPTRDEESAIVRTLTPGNYTAVVRGVNQTTGVALVEVYALN